MKTITNGYEFIKVKFRLHRNAENFTYKGCIMELAKLRYFYTVAKLGHVTKAAEEIHIAQPALTKAIKQLEEELGAPLFYKKGRNIYLTVFGEYLKNKLDGILPQIDNIGKELQALKQEQRNTVKLNVLAASTAVTDAVVSYKKKNKGVVFQLIQNEEETDCDVSVSMKTGNTSALPVFLKRYEMDENIYLAVPKNSPYASSEHISLIEVKEEGFVHLAGSRVFRTVCDKFCALAGFQPHISFESDSPMAVRNIIGAHAGVGFWPEYSWGKVSSDVVLLPINEPICQRVLVLGLHDSPTPSTVAEDFYEYLIKFLQNRRKRKP
ncbi:MAG: LysR family transcriptional regulator [Clostridia bacterium]|nr:LysR family transcriptional regulator [Clostridia bacterium]